MARRALIWATLVGQRQVAAQAPQCLSLQEVSSSLLESDGEKPLSLVQTMVHKVQLLQPPVIFEPPNLTDTEYQYNHSRVVDILGIGKNKEGDLEAFLSALGVNFVTMCAALLVFNVLRTRFPSIYSHNVTISCSGLQQMKDLLEHPLGAVRASMRLSIDDIVKEVGLDQAMVIEHSILGMKIMIALGLPAMLVLTPLHLFWGGHAAGNDYLSWVMFNNVADDSWICWVQSAYVWYSVVVVQWLVFRTHAQVYMPQREKWLLEMPPPQSKTILVENIPLEYRSKEKLEGFFNEIFGAHAVEEVAIVKYTTNLQQAVSRREQLAHLLEQTRFKEQSGTARPRKPDDLEPAGQESLEKQLAEAEKLVLELRKEILASDSFNCGTAFIKFTHRHQREIALKVSYTEDDEEFVVSVPPDPSDVIFSDLQVEARLETARETLGYTLLAILFFSYLPIVLSISDLTSLESLKRTIPAVAKLEHSYPKLTTLWDGLMGSFVLTLAMSFLPTLLSLIFYGCFELRAAAWLQHRLQQWYFYALVVFVLLIKAVGDSLFMSLEYLAAHPFALPHTLAVALSEATHFYLNYVPMQWVTHATNMTRMVPLAKFLVLRQVCTEERARELSEPEDQDYYGIGSRCARHSLLLVTCIVFGGLAPPIILLGLIDFFILRVLYGYLLVFAESKKPDLGGMFWCTQMRHLQQGLLIFIVLMVGVLLRRAATSGPGLLAAGSVVYWLVAYTRFARRFRLDTLPLRDIQAAKSDHRPSRRSTYLQPELVASSPSRG